MRDFKRSSSSSRETKKIRQILNEEIKLGIHPSSDSETEEVDFQKELHPLSHYMNNREEMIEQMFSIIKGDKLKNMLPPILKDMPLDELKADCLIHLLGMSKKRIRAILEGKEINSSSDSESHSDNSSPRKGAKPFMKPMVIKQEGCSDISDNSEEVILIDPDRDPVQQSSSTSKATKDDGKVKSKKRRKKELHLKNTNVSISQTISKKIQELDIQEVDKSGDESSPESTSNTEDNAPKEGKTLLEILELEMRARAIRALLHKTDSTGTEGKLPKNQNPVEAEKSGTTELKPERKLRKKKRKNDDVIVITPKVITIDLTDENNYPSTAKKKPKDLSNDKQVENINSSDAPKKVETTDKSETVDISNKYVDVTELEDCSTKTDEEKEQRITNASVEISHCSKQSNLQDLEKAKNEKSNWAQRWLESKEVKKVVSTSKICGNIRKRIKNAKLAKQNQAPILDDQNKQGPHKDEVKSQEIEGRVDEYQLLPKSNNVSVFNANPSNACNSELSSVSTEENSGGNIETTNKETSSSGEQVQDVTSTECESLKEETSCQESPLCESIQELSAGNSNSCVDDSTSSTRPNDDNILNSNHNIILESTNLDENESQNCDLDFKEKESSNDSKSDSCKKHTSSPQSNKAQFDDEQLESDINICLKEELGNSELYPKTGAHSELISSSENEIIQCISKLHETKFDCLESNLTDSESKVFDLKSNFSEVKSPSPPIEPETLEINITDEDRDIDGICDDKSELDSGNTTKEVSIEIN